ncbi:winged helix-turn-helix domain-containing protein [Lentzea sp. DG1S-22]|uniref:winged helix-turn-helix domain-containing protein n=1 Tax=Lentzea sp. DG1S-22 TaxID=3108822 RepID=UPI002E76F887|nr:winged helix-turn-helix domain-containing protein [Lentzea sp. DG1S-22]WVH82768.1 winged helix-turn-helix domain-containing protein [Lentzea sp. DG1S-22]
MSKLDLEARITALRNRIRRTKSPLLDDTGTLYYNSTSVTVSDAQAALLDLFIARFAQVVSREQLETQLARRDFSPTRNSLDLLIMRLRKRLAEVGLSVRTVWGRGYVLEPAAREQSA